MYDFGHIDTYREFDGAVANLIGNITLAIGRIFEPHHPGLVRPNPEIAVDSGTCDRYTVNASGCYAAQQFRKAGGAIDQTRIERMMRLMRLTALRRNDG